MIRLLFTFLLVGCFNLSFAQGGGTADRKAQNAYLEAKQHKKFGRNEMAEINFQKALERDPEYVDAMYELSDLYLRMGRVQDSRELMERIVAKDKTYAPNILVNLALMAQNEEDFETALGYYEDYMTMAPEGSNNHNFAKLGAANCEFAIWAMANPVPFDPINLGENVNSAEHEYFPTMTADESLLIYTREIDAPNNPYSPDGRDEDFYFSEKDENGAWGPAYNPGMPINSPWREGAPSISPDGKYIIFTVCDLYGQYGPDKQGFGSCDLFISVRNGKSWSKPVNMGRTINTKHWESQPCFAADGKTIYFVRGYYNRDHERFDDIYYTELIDGKWAEAKAMPPNINSKDDEESVFLHPDNKTLYFSSRGHVGLGNMDIYMSRRQPNGDWSDPVNLGYPINTVGHENSFFVSADGKYAIIASDREGGYGGLDLYSFELAEALRPEPVTYLKGRITDAETKQPLEASFRLINLNTGDTVIQAYSDKVNGGYLVVLPVSENYALMAEMDGYLYHSENFQLDLSQNLPTYTKNIELQPIREGSSVVLKNVFFDTDKYDLKPASQTELNKLVRLMQDYPEISIEISGHTDNQGNPAANKTLSQNRAKAVFNYLVEKGIDAARLTSAGYGEEHPIATNDTPEGRAQNRRTEFRITKGG